ncbi:MAG: phage tail tape measure protein [Alphaproteobacteria bacterium]|nr:phage tail tape measure protein [Alphaproteobacteria bacterium]
MPAQQISLEYTVRLEQLKAQLGSIPGLNRKTANAVQRDFTRAWKSAEKDATKAAKAASRAWSAGTGQIKSALGGLIPGFSQVSAAGETLTGVLGGGSTGLAAALGAVGVAVAGFVGFAKLAKDAEATRRQIVELTQTTNLLPKTLSAIEVAGGDLDKLGPALGELNARIVQVEQGSKRATKAFDALGVSVTDANGNVRSADDVFTDLVGALQDVDSEAERAGLATQVFGSAGRDLMATLGDTRMADWVDLSREFGVRVGPDAARASVAWQTATSSLGIALRSAADDFSGLFGAEDAAGLLNRFATGFVAASAFLETWGSEVTKRAEVIALKLRRAFEGEQATPTTTVIRDANGNEVFSAEWEDSLSGRIKRLEEDIAASTGAMGEAWDAAAEKAAKYMQLVQARQAAASATVATGSRSSVVAPAGGGASTPTVDSAGGVANAGGYADILSTMADLTVASSEFAAIRRQVFATEVSGVDQINAKYDEQLAHLETLRAYVWDEQSFKDTILEIEKARIDELAAYEQAAREESFQKNLSNTQGILGAIGSTAGAIGDIVAEVYDRQIASAEKGSDAQKRLMRKQFAASKAMAIIQATINTALAVVNALATAPNIIAGIALAAVVGALGAVQIGLIASQQAPSFHQGGVISAGPSAPDEVGINAQRGEGVVTRRGMDRLGARGLESLNSGQGLAPTVIVAATSEHKVLDYQMATTVSRRGPRLRRALQAAASRPGLR